MNVTGKFPISGQLLPKSFHYLSIYLHNGTQKGERLNVEVKQLTPPPQCWHGSNFIFAGIVVVSDGLSRTPLAAV